MLAIYQKDLSKREKYLTGENVLFKLQITLRTGLNEKVVVSEKGW